MNTVQKTCFKCGLSKARTEFYTHPQMNDGLLGKCKECTKRDVRRNRGDATREYDRRRYRERTHEHKARIAVQAAIAKGTLTRPEGCWYCGRECQPEAHHADYQNRLGVVFLCNECHMDCHKATTVAKCANDYAIRLSAHMDRPSRGNR